MASAASRGIVGGRPISSTMQTVRHLGAMPTLPSGPGVSILFLLIVGLDLRANGVVVDGNKRVEMSPMRGQTRDESSAIDSFNTKTCGMADPNYNEHEFVNMAREGQFPWLVSFQIKILEDLSYGKQLEVSKKSLNETTGRPGARNGPHGAARAKKREQKWEPGPKKREDLHFCSGSFISDLWILSAAHCFSDRAFQDYLSNDKLIAVAGSNRVSSRSRLNRNLTIERVYVHSKFQPASPIGYDVALVELRPEARANFSQKRHRDEFGEQRAPFINSICLPVRDKAYAANESARIAGWGLSQARDAHTMPSKLLTTDLLLSRTDECLERYKAALRPAGATANRTGPARPRDLLCAGYKTTRDACQSDSGGPLMQYANKKAVVIGIVSYGMGCATKGVPGLYTRTAAYTGWIEAITRGRREARADFRVLESRRVGGLDQAATGEVAAAAAAATDRTQSEGESESRQRPARRKAPAGSGHNNEDERAN